MGTGWQPWGRGHRRERKEDSGVLSRPCRKRRPSSRDDRGIWWVFSSCGVIVGFLTRYDEDLREPLVRCQGTHVSMRMARGSWSSLSSGSHFCRKDAWPGCHEGRVVPALLKGALSAVSSLSRLRTASDQLCPQWEAIPLYLCCWSPVEPHPNQGTGPRRGTAWDGHVCLQS